MTASRTVRVGKIDIANDRPFVLLAGPCALASRDHAPDVAEVLVAVCGRTRVPLIYESSLDKAKRTILTHRRGIVHTAAYDILRHARVRLSMPVLTDLHTPSPLAAADRTR